MLNPYHQLTTRGKLRRLRGLAEDALRQFGVTAVRLKLISTDTNLIYRVWSDDDRQFALRVANPAWRGAETAVSEAMWLDALAQDTDIPVPKMMRTPVGDAVVFPQAAGVPIDRHAVLMSWQPGVLLGKRLAVQNITKMGELFAKLHQHGASWQPPDEFTTKKFDNFLSRGEPNVLFAEGSLANYDAQTESLLRQMSEVVAQTYADLDPADLRVIHCDLWHDNIKIHKGKLYPFDFEDTIWGYRLHDMAMALLDLYEDVGDSEAYATLLAAFRTGYETLLPWPDGEMELLMFGRLLWKTNWIACFWPEGLAKTAVFHANLYDHYRKIGELLPPKMPR
ncbi:phosphotransferase enzyme family protein [Candidatus Leptofilum sp.]|uniref:phosphotransferase enzyme family protein n=1 Tax=Candidatus Leptofilum sp. TaxID=3241576 RepID=UPI003B5A135B